MPYYIVWKYLTETMVYTHRVTNKKQKDNTQNGRKYLLMNQPTED